MPPQYKILISLLALIVTTTLFILDTNGGGAGRWVALFLGPLMVVAIWIFPEPKAKNIRNEAAKRR